MLRKYLSLMRTGWIMTMEYRTQILIWMMSSFLVIIMLMVWLSITKNGPVGGFSSEDFVSYYAVAFFVRQLTAVWASWELDYKIREGKLSPELLRPMHPIHHEISVNWAEKVLRIIIIVPILIILLAALPHTPLNLSLPNLLLFVLSVFGAWVICFMSDYLLGILGFWTTQSTAFVQMFFTVRIALSGILAPTQMFPAGIQAALQWLPFRYMLAFCSDILMGKLTTPDIVFGLVVQWAWAAVFIFGVRGLWRVAMKSYGAVGA